jgi:hypothetical protein
MSKYMHEPEIPDGRHVYIPPRQPRRLRHTTVRMIREQFERSGFHSSSVQAQTLQVLLDHCHSEGIGYRLAFLPASGYTVERLDGRLDNAVPAPGPYIQDIQAEVAACVRQGTPFETVFVPGSGTRMHIGAFDRPLEVDADVPQAGPGYPRNGTVLSPRCRR